MCRKRERFKVLAQFADGNETNKEFRTILFQAFWHKGTFNKISYKSNTLYVLLWLKLRVFTVVYKLIDHNMTVVLWCSMNVWGSLCSKSRIMGLNNAMTCSCLLWQEMPFTFTLHHKNHVTLTLQWQMFIFLFWYSLGSTTAVQSLFIFYDMFQYIILQSRNQQVLLCIDILQGSLTMGSVH